MFTNLQAMADFGPTEFPSLHKKVGRGLGKAHHGELLQGAFRDADGRIRRGLVTMPCATYGSRATFVPSHLGEAKVEVRPAHYVKALRAAELTLESLQLPHLGGQLALDGDIAVGHGLGSSTADVVAAIRAVASAFGIDLSPLAVARIAVAAETASDSTMFDGAAVLFAQRDGVVLETFAAALPPMLALGVDTDPGATVDTLALSNVSYSEQLIDEYALLRRYLRRAIEHRDVPLLGRVASESARLNQAILPTPRLDELMAIASTHGAAGVQISHSGTVASLLFDARDPRAEALRRGAEARLCSEAFAVTIAFRC